MKRFVREVANEMLRRIDDLHQLDCSILMYHGELTAENENRLSVDYTVKRHKVKELLEQCEYGYISDLEAVRLLTNI